MVTRTRVQARAGTQQAEAVAEVGAEVEGRLLLEAEVEVEGHLLQGVEAAAAALLPHHWVLEEVQVPMGGPLGVEEGEA